MCHDALSPQKVTPQAAITKMMFAHGDKRTDTVGHSGEGLVNYRALHGSSTQMEDFLFSGSTGLRSTKRTYVVHGFINVPFKERSRRVIQRSLTEVLPGGSRAKSFRGFIRS